MAVHSTKIDKATKIDSHNRIKKTENSYLSCTAGKARRIRVKLLIYLYLRELLSEIGVNGQ